MPPRLRFRPLVKPPLTVEKILALADLLYRQRGVLNRKAQPPLTIAQILKWAEAQHTLFGAWPSKYTGPIGNTGETWESVNAALRLGLRTLPGGSSLSQLLKEHG